MRQISNTNMCLPLILGLNVKSPVGSIVKTPPEISILLYNAQKFSYPPNQPLRLTYVISYAWISCDHHVTSDTN